VALFLIASYDPLDPATTRRKFLYASRPSSPKRYHLGVVKGSFENVDPQVKENFLQSVKVLAEFADIGQDVELPNYPYGPILGTVMAAESAAAFREQVDSGQMREMANSVDRVDGYVGSLISAVDYLQAMRVRRPRASIAG
jgi:aspartyl-tRNA(Asn)/glutamyl-tRNA(Gln) amidotransferase subunit A